MDLMSLPVLTDVKMLQKMGSGNFGEVYKGEWQVKDFNFNIYIFVFRDLLWR